MRYRFPSDDEHPLAPEWSAPLLKVSKALATPSEYLSDRFFDPHDFMIMCRLVRGSQRPDLTLYKHHLTRRYLNLDDDGHAYRYFPPRHDRRPNYLGQYRRHRDFRAAVAELGLWELPWMKPGLETATFGYSWNERWELFDDDTGDLRAVPDGVTGVIGPDECEMCREELRRVPAPAAGPTRPPRFTVVPGPSDGIGRGS